MMCSGFIERICSILVEEVEVCMGCFEVDA